MGRTPDIGGVRRGFMFILFYLHPPEALPIEGELSEGLRGSFSLNHYLFTTNNVYTHGGVEHAATLQVVNLG